MRAQRLTGEHKSDNVIKCTGIILPNIANGFAETMGLL